MDPDPAQVDPFPEFSPFTSPVDPPWHHCPAKERAQQLLPLPEGSAWLWEPGIFLLSEGNGGGGGNPSLDVGLVPVGWGFWGASNWDISGVTWERACPALPHPGAAWAGHGAAPNYPSSSITPTLLTLPHFPLTPQPPFSPPRHPKSLNPTSPNPHPPAPPQRAQPQQKKPQTLRA